MNINIVDCIPDDKPHCGNCTHFKLRKNDDLVGGCALEKKKRFSFEVCKDDSFKWEKSSNA